MKKVSIKTAAKNTRQAAAKKPKPKQKARRVVRRTGPSQATLAGLRQTDDPLQLGSSVAYAMDQDTGEELVVKNADVELPIASVTKLMTALVIAESDVDLDEKVRITREDYVRSTAHSKLISGMRLTRESLLKAALMSSDNRAAAALARTYPGGRKAFVAKMNERAAAIGMTNSFLLIRRGWITAITPRHVIWANWLQRSTSIRKFGMRRPLPWPASARAAGRSISRRPIA